MKYIYLILLLLFSCGRENTQTPIAPYVMYPIVCNRMFRQWGGNIYPFNSNVPILNGQYTFTELNGISCTYQVLDGEISEVN